MVLVDPVVLDQPAPVGTSRETTLDAPVRPSYPIHVLLARVGATTLTASEGPAALDTPGPMSQSRGDSNEHAGF